jgi:hypothetical protein
VTVSDRRDYLFVLAGLVTVFLILRGFASLAVGTEIGPEGGLSDQQERQIERTCTDSAIYQGFKPGQPGFAQDVASCERRARLSISPAAGLD